MISLPRNTSLLPRYSFPSAIHQLTTPPLRSNRKMSPLDPNPLLSLSLPPGLSTVRRTSSPLPQCTTRPKCNPPSQPRAPRYQSSVFVRPDCTCVDPKIKSTGV